MYQLNRCSNPVAFGEFDNRTSGHTPPPKKPDYNSTALKEAISQRNDDGSAPVPLGTPIVELLQKNPHPQVGTQEHRTARSLTVWSFVCAISNTVISTCKDKWGVFFARMLGFSMNEYVAIGYFM